LFSARTINICSLQYIVGSVHSYPSMALMLRPSEQMGDET
jgi:hypothetical protein